MTNLENATRFRISYIPQIPMPAFEREYSDFQTAKAVLNAVIRFSIFEFDNNVKPDYSDIALMDFWDEEYGDWENIDDKEWEEDYEV